jgi:hypothetical protein
MFSGLHLVVIWKVGLVLIAFGCTNIQFNPLNSWVAITAGYLTPTSS